MLKRITLTGCALGATLAFAAPAFAQTHVKANAATATATEYVTVHGSDTNTDGTTNTCRIQKNACLTIQHAINVGPPSGTIKVGAGTFPEQLTIDGKNLTITGVGDTAKGTVIQPTSLLQTNNDPAHPGETSNIVSFQNTTGGGLTKVLVDASQVSNTDPAKANCSNFNGIFVLDATTTLNTDAVAHVRKTDAMFACQTGFGVYAVNSPGNTTNLTTNALAVTDYDKNGIVCRNSGTNCDITAGKVTGDGAIGSLAQNGIEIFDATGSVTKTNVSQNTYTSPNFDGANGDFNNASGILVINSGDVQVTHAVATKNDVNLDAIIDTADFGPATSGTWTFTGNTLTGATNVTGSAGGSVKVPAGDGVGDGLDLYAGSGAVVTSNTVTGNSDEGISLFGTSNSQIGGDDTSEGNLANKNKADGIFVTEFDTNTPSANDLIGFNTASTNKADGIHADGIDGNGDLSERTNTFSGNIMNNDTRFDAEDRSVGAGTGETANTWSGNQCKPAADSRPLELCTTP